MSGRGAAVGGPARDLHEHLVGHRGRIGLEVLPAPPVDRAAGANAPHGARLVAALLRVELAPEIVCRVLVERDAETRHLLRAPADDPVLVYVEVTAAGAALERGAAFRHQA